MGFNINLGKFGAPNKINCPKCQAQNKTYINDLDLEDYFYSNDNFYKYEITCVKCSYEIKAEIKLVCKFEIK